MLLQTLERSSVSHRPICRCLAPLVATAIVTSLAGGQQAALPTPLDNPKAQASYGIGRQFVQNLRQGGLSDDLLDLAALIRGIEDAATGDEPQVTQEQFQAAMAKIQHEI